MSELAVGLMSGTSIDGVDAALVEIESAGSARLVAFHCEPFPEETREFILRVITEGRVHNVTILDVALGEAFARAAAQVIEHGSVTSAAVSVIGSHGQTIWHEPGKATLQLGNPAVIAEHVGVPVVSDFRSRDIAAGGQGAPLVPIADAMLFGGTGHGRVLLNIGGMANFTWVPRRGSIDGVVACDTGPGVAVIDAVTRLIDPAARFDESGARARRGDPVDEVVDELLEHPFFQKPPPKSTGRELFGEEYARRLVARVKDRRSGATGDDCVATALSLTVRAVCEHVERWVPPNEDADLVVSGGGARNPALVERLRSYCGLSVRLFEEEFFDGDAKEAVAFAYLGWLTLHGMPGNVPPATGAKGLRVLGSVTPSGARSP